MFTFRLKNQGSGKNSRKTEVVQICMDVDTSFVTIKLCKMTCDDVWIVSVTRNEVGEVHV
jgi:hypothetical protein